MPGTKTIHVAPGTFLKWETDEEGDSMYRSFIPFHLNKEENYTLYYDYKESRFFKSSGAKQGGLLPTLSGTAGVILYTYFKDSLIHIGAGSPLGVTGFSLMIGCLLFIVIALGISAATNKDSDKIEFVTTPSPEDILIYIREGRKWLKSSIRLIFYFFLFTLVALVALYLDPTSGLLFFANIVLWALVLFLIYGVRFFKRVAIYKKMEKEIMKREDILIGR